MFTPIEFSSERGQQTDPKIYREAQITYPVFNLIERASKDTLLTRPTILEIFKEMKDEKKENIFKNPEGFAEIFIHQIKEALANNVAENIEYEMQKELEDFEYEEMFPKTKKYPQKELIDGSDHSMYDFVQIDSDVEKYFVENRLKEDDRDGKVICYFKFPSTFKVNMPKIIGNYTPDWGVIRLSDDGKKKYLNLVRETKGTIQREHLRFPNEGRKIVCAEKHFSKLEIDYRDVTHEIPKWFNEKQR